MKKTGFQLERLVQFAFIPNGVEECLAAFLIPLDWTLSRCPGVKNLAMRIALAASKPSVNS